MATPIIPLRASGLGQVAQKGTPAAAIAPAVTLPTGSGRESSIRELSAPESAAFRTTSGTLGASASVSRQPVEHEAEASSLGGTGFAGRLRCATLADLVQLQCYSRARVGVLVNSDGQAGVLHFDAGDVVHARVTGGARLNLEGNEAALEVLSWVGGDFEMFDLTPPVERSVSLPWAHLLLTAAQRYDEAQRCDQTQRGGEVDEPPGPSAAEFEPRAASLTSVTESSGARALSALREEPAAPQAALAVPPAPADGLLPDLSGLSCEALSAIRLDNQGHVLAGRGDVQQLASLCQFIRRVVTLVGDEFGFSPVRYFEGRSQTRQIFAYPTEDRHWVALAFAPAADLSGLRIRFTR